MYDEKYYIALDMAICAHDGQDRGQFKNYIVHPIEVANVLGSDPSIPQDVILAALLHDTMEDGGMKYNFIYNQFGSIVADLVLEVTDDPRLPRAAQKLEQIEKMQTMSQWAICLKLADRATNICGLTLGRKPTKAYIEHTKLMLASFYKRMNETEQQVKYRNAFILVGKIEEGILRFASLTG